MAKEIKIYSVDELNNMQLEELENIEKEVWSYFKKIKAVITFTEEVEKE